MEKNGKGKEEVKEVETISECAGDFTIFTRGHGMIILLVDFLDHPLSSPKLKNWARHMQ